METNLNNVIKMYDKLTYFDQYGGSLVLFIVITIVVVLLVSYFQTMANIQPIIDDWPNQRCKPTIMPFAGLITRPAGVTASEYTSQNFNYCTQNILSNISGYSLQPLTYVANTLQLMLSSLQQSIQSIRGMFDKIRTSMQSISEEIMGRILNVTIPLQQIVISFRDLIGKIQGTMTAGLFTFLGSYYALKSLMGAIAQFIITILIAIATMVAVFWVMPFTWGAAIANTSIFVAIAIPMAIILAFMSDVLNVRAGKIPKIKCFDRNTIIAMNDGTYKKIININVNDVLSNNNKVTAKIKVTTKGSDMYTLDNVIVSDSHIVKFNNAWIPVSKHPDAVKCDYYAEPFLYCLNTTNKTIQINNTIFTDWDELYEDSLQKVINNNLIPINALKDIHTYLDYGFVETTKIKLANGSYKNINKISINDILENGEIVYGLVEIDGLDISENISYNLGKNPLKNVKECVSDNNQKLYHLLTDKKTFKVGNVIIPDYNDAIDRFLEISI